MTVTGENFFSLVGWFLIISALWWGPALSHLFLRWRERRTRLALLEPQQREPRPVSKIRRFRTGVWNFFHPDLTKSLDEFHVFVEKTGAKYVTIFPQQTLKIYTSDDAVMVYEVRALAITSHGRMFGYVEKVDWISSNADEKCKRHDAAEIKSKMRVREVGQLLTARLSRQTRVDVAA